MMPFDFAWPGSSSDNFSFCALDAAGSSVSIHYWPPHGIGLIASWLDSVSNYSSWKDCWWALAAPRRHDCRGLSLELSPSANSLQLPVLWIAAKSGAVPALSMLKP